MATIIDGKELSLKIKNQFKLYRLTKSLIYNIINQYGKMAENATILPCFCTKITKEVNNLSYKNIQYGRTRVRRNYARVQTNVELPNLIEIQTESFKWLMETGLKELFTEISPIKEHEDGGKVELSFLDSSPSSMYSMPSVSIGSIS